MLQSYNSLSYLVHNTISSVKWQRQKTLINIKGPNKQIINITKKIIRNIQLYSITNLRY